MPEEIEPNPLLTHTNKIYFSPGYKDDIFLLWYSMGKPMAKVLWNNMPLCPEAGNKKPSYDLVHDWVLHDFKERAIPIDTQVMQQVNDRMISEKVEMLNRHATVAIEMQDIGMKFLKEHENDLKVSDAVKLLVAGIEIERESRGIATTVEKITSMSDDQLNKEIQRLILREPVTMLPGGEDIEDADLSSESQTE